MIFQVILPTGLTIIGEMASTLPNIALLKPCVLDANEKGFRMLRKYTCHNDELLTIVGVSNVLVQRVDESTPFYEAYKKTTSSIEIVPSIASLDKKRSN